MERIVFVGTTGSGKSTLGEMVARRLNLPFVDLDAIHWLPNWEERPVAEFRERVADALQGDEWIVAGNYSKARDLIWSKADTLVWLDYPLWLTQWRLLRRTINRITTQENLWGTGNRETWRAQFFSKDSLFLWALQSQPKHRAIYPLLFCQPEYTHLNIYRLASPAAARRWLKNIAVKR